MVDERDRAARTALHYAAVDDELDVLRGLIRDGADVNVRDDAGWTPLHFAANQGNLEIAQELVRAGADVRALNGEGEEPLFRAVTRGKLGHKREVAELLLDSGADPHRQAANGLSPASYLAEIVDSPVKSLFVERGVQMS